MERKATTKLMKIATLAAVLFYGGSAFCQEKIREVYGCEGETIIRGLDSSRSVICYQADDQPYFCVVDKNNNSVTVIVFHDSMVRQVTDFYAEHGEIIMCGQLYSNSQWFVGSMYIPSATSPTSDFTYVPIYNVSKLSKVQRLTPVWLWDVLTVGNDNSGNAVLLETVYKSEIGSPSHFRTYTLPLVDTASSNKYIADDLIVLDNYIVASSHKSSNSLFELFSTTYGKLWFVDNPQNSDNQFSHIDSSKVYQLNTDFFTSRPIYLAKKNGTRFYTAGTSEFFRDNNAIVSWYIEGRNQSSVKFSQKSSSYGIAYNPTSNDLEVLVATYSSGFMPQTYLDKVYSFNSNLLISGNTVYGHQYSGYSLHSVAPNKWTRNLYAISGVENSTEIPNHGRVIWFKSGNWGICPTQISATVTTSELSKDFLKTVNNATCVVSYPVNTTVIYKETILRPKCN